MKLFRNLTLIYFVCFLFIFQSCNNKDESEQSSPKTSEVSFNSNLDVYIGKKDHVVIRTRTEEESAEIFKLNSFHKSLKIGVENIINNSLYAKSANWESDDLSTIVGIPKETVITQGKPKIGHVILKYNLPTQAKESFENLYNGLRGFSRDIAFTKYDPHSYFEASFKKSDTSIRQTAFSLLKELLGKKESKLVVIYSNNYLYISIGPGANYKKSLEYLNSFGNKVQKDSYYFRTINQLGASSKSNRIVYIRYGEILKDYIEKLRPKFKRIKTEKSELADSLIVARGDGITKSQLRFNAWNTAYAIASYLGTFKKLNKKIQKRISWLANKLLSPNAKINERNLTKEELNCFFEHTAVAVSVESSMINLLIRYSEILEGWGVSKKKFKFLRYIDIFKRLFSKLNLDTKLTFTFEAPFNKQKNGYGLIFYGDSKKMEGLLKVIATTSHSISSSSTHLKREVLGNDRLKLILYKTGYGTMYGTSINGLCYITNSISNIKSFTILDDTKRKKYNYPTGVGEFYYNKFSKQKSLLSIYFNSRALRELIDEVSVSKKGLPFLGSIELTETLRNDYKDGDKIEFYSFSNPEKGIINSTFISHKL